MNITRPTAIAQAARRLPLLLCAGMVPAVALAGPVSITDVSAGYAQNFDGLATTGSNTWTNGTTLEGWYAFNGPTATAISSYRADTGTGTTGSLASYGATSSTDRALGALVTAPTGPGFQPFVLLALTNDTGADIAAFALSYDGEQWRNAATGLNTRIAVGYRKGDTYSATGYTSAGNGSTFNSPITSGTAGPLNGNDSANRKSDLGGTVTTNWAAGETMWLRFIFTPGGIGTNNGIAIDNLSLSFTPATTTPPNNDVPEPGSLALVAAGLAAAWARSRR